MIALFPLFIGSTLLGVLLGLFFNGERGLTTVLSLTCIVMILIIGILCIAGGLGFITLGEANRLMFG